MNFEIAFAITLGFVGGFIFAIIVLVGLFKKIVKIVKVMDGNGGKNE